MILLELGKGIQMFIVLIKRIDIKISGNNIYRVMENQPIQSILERTLFLRANNFTLLLSILKVTKAIPDVLENIV